MIVNRKINAFKLVSNRIEYSQMIKDAVLNPKIYIKKLHINRGWDWVDKEYGFIKLLLNRGQIREVETHSDLLACDDYLNAAKLGLSRSYSPSIHFYSLSIHFVYLKQTKKSGYASEKRMNAAKEKWISFVNIKSA